MELTINGHTVTATFDVQDLRDASWLDTYGSYNEMNGLVQVNVLLTIDGKPGYSVLLQTGEEDNKSTKWLEVAGHAAGDSANMEATAVALGLDRYDDEGDIERRDTYAAMDAAFDEIIAAAQELYDVEFS